MAKSVFETESEKSANTLTNDNVRSAHNFIGRSVHVTKDALKVPCNQESVKGRLSPMGHLKKSSIPSTNQKNKKQGRIN